MELKCTMWVRKFKRRYIVRLISTLQYCFKWRSRQLLLFIRFCQQRTNNNFSDRNFASKNSIFVYTSRYFFFWKDALESAWRIFWWENSDTAVVCCVGLKCWHVNQHLACSKQRLACTTRLLVNKSILRPDSESLSCVLSKSLNHLSDLLN